jgi:hypothetical protein
MAVPATRYQPVCQRPWREPYRGSIDVSRAGTVDKLNFAEGTSREGSADIKDKLTVGVVERLE